MGKNRIDIMVDIETLGIELDSTIIQVGAIAFNIDSGEYLEFFNEYVNIEKNKELKVSGSTLQWWLKTNANLLKEIITKQDQSSDTVSKKLYDWIVELKNKYEVYLWGNGIAFDNSMIKTAIKNIGLEYPIKYTNDRDVRTILELASIKSGKTEKEIKSSVKLDGIAHDAFYDCKVQIAYVSKCWKYLTKGDEKKCVQ